MLRVGGNGSDKLQEDGEGTLTKNKNPPVVTKASQM